MVFTGWVVCCSRATFFIIERSGSLFKQIPTSDLGPDNETWCGPNKGPVASRIMKYPDPLPLPHMNSPLNAAVELPGSKSLTNRVLLLAALADCTSRFDNVLIADDTRLMVQALRSLGVSVQCDEINGNAIVQGCSGLWPNDEAVLDAGHAGTVARFITAACCIGRGQFRIDGSPRMRKRPLRPLIGALRELGAYVNCEGEEGHLPLAIAGRGLRGKTVTIPGVISSQFISALLLVAPLAQGDVLMSLEEPPPSKPYIGLTLKAMEAFGVGVAEHDMQKFIVPAPQAYRATKMVIEPDASAASYFWGAAALAGGRVEVRGLSKASWQGDVGFAAVLGEMGCDVEFMDDAIAVTGPEDGKLRGVDVDLEAMPDVAQTLAVIAAFAEGPTVMRNVGNLRVKETDRLTAVVNELGKMHVTATVEGERDLHVIPPSDGAVHAARIATYNDHRMAMSFTLASIRLENMEIEGPQCVSKTLPDFFDRWQRLWSSK